MNFLMSIAVAHILAMLCGILSPLIISKKQAFMGAAISHSTFFGLALSFYFFHPEDSLKIYLFTLFVTLILSFFLATAGLEKLLPFESLMGLFFSTSMGFGILLFYFLRNNEHIDLHEYLFGDILLLDKTDIIISLLNLLLVSVTVMACPKKWIYFITDSESASVAGQRTKLFHYGMILLLTVTIVSSLKIAGIILVNSMLLIPGIFSLKIAQRTRDVFLFSILFSLLSTAIGALVIKTWAAPAGATIGCTQFVLLCLALAMKRLWWKNKA